jgi:Tfp pilus assembly protein PilF
MQWFEISRKEFPTWVSGVFMLCLCLLLYANTLDNDFVLDDNAYIVDNYLLRDLGNLPKFIDVPADATVEDLQPGFLRGRNVRWLTYAVDYAIASGRPWLFHLSNIVWHALAAIGLFLLTQRWLTGSLSALLAAALFAAHPIQTAAVSYISGRKDILAAVFVVLALLLIEKMRESGQSRWGWLAGAAYLFGFFSKESAIVLPLLLLWCDWCRQERLNVAALRAVVRRNWRHYAWLFALAGVLAVRTVGFDAIGQAIGLSPAPVANLASPVAGVAAVVENRSFANLMLFYWWKLIFPANLLADYRDVFSFSLYPPTWGRRLSPLFAVALAVGLYFLHRVRPWAVLGAGWVLIALLPVSHLIPFHYPVAEHYLYLPAAGFALMLIGLGAHRESWTGRELAVWAMVLIVMATMTIARNGAWQNMETVTHDILTKAPRHQRARNTLVHLLIEKGDLQQALVQATIAVRQDPGSPVNHYNLGIIHENLRDIDQAAFHYRAAIQLRPNLWDAYLNLGNLLLTSGRTAEGETVIERLMAGYGYHPLALWVLGNQRAREGRWPEAEQLYRRQVALDQHDALGYLGLAGAAWYTGQREAALGHLDTALRKGLSIERAASQEPWATFLKISEIRQVPAALGQQ